MRSTNLLLLLLLLQASSSRRLFGILRSRAFHRWPSSGGPRHAARVGQIYAVVVSSHLSLAMAACSAEGGRFTWTVSGVRAASDSVETSLLRIDVKLGCNVPHTNLSVHLRSERRDTICSMERALKNDGLPA